MSAVSFNGGESTGSIGYLKAQQDNGESTGSIAKRARYEAETGASLPEPLDKDTVSFRGEQDNPEKKSSILGKLAKLAIAAGVIVGGLGYAHKAGYISKIGNERVKGYLNNVAEPCHNICAGAKKQGVELYEKIVGYFRNKS